MKVCGREIQFNGKLLRIARLDADDYQFLDDPEIALRAIRESGVRADLFTFMQKVSDTTPKYNYPMEWDDRAVLPISTFDHWWKDQIRFKARNKAKQAEKRGVVIQEVPFDEALVRGVWEIYNECPVRQGRRFRHFGKDLTTVHEMTRTFLDQSIFIGAFFEGKLIGFVKLVTDKTRSQAGLMHIVSMIQHKDKAPTNALIAQAVRSCAERSIPFLVYSSFSRWKETKDGMVDFKERNGFKRVSVPRYFIPMTLAGRIALRLGLHHRFVDRVPESVATRLRELRNVWYNRKSHAIPEALNLCLEEFFTLKSHSLHKG